MHARRKIMKKENTEVKMPKRAEPWDVGKFIGGRIYFHKNYQHMFPELHGRIEVSKIIAGEDLINGYICIRFDTMSDCVAFQFSEDFDTSDEPTVSKTVSVARNGKVLIKYSAQGNEQIWHHKWLWVMDDYKGFDVEAAKERSRLWLPHVKKHEKNKIGYRKYWDSIRDRWEG